MVDFVVKIGSFSMNFEYKIGHNSRTRNRKIDFSIVSEHCAAICTKKWRRLFLRGMGGLHILNLFLPTVPIFAVRETDIMVPEVPPLCRETSFSRTANVGTVGKNGLNPYPMCYTGFIIPF